MTAAAAPAPTTPKSAFTEVLHTALEVATTTVARTVDGWTEKLDSVGGGSDNGVGGVLDDALDGESLEDTVDDLTPDLGTKGQAAVSATTAGLQGKNPVWAAVKGAWSAGGTKVKVAIVAAVVTLVLLLLLSPVLLLLLLIAGLIVLAVVKAKKH